MSVFMVVFLGRILSSLGPGGKWVGPFTAAVAFQLEAVLGKTRCTEF
jgi:hypothetical protein